MSYYINKNKILPRSNEACLNTITLLITAAKWLTVERHSNDGGKVDEKSINKVVIEDVCPERGIWTYFECREFNLSWKDLYDYIERTNIVLEVIYNK